MWNRPAVDPKYSQASSTHTAALSTDELRLLRSSKKMKPQRHWQARPAGSGNHQTTIADRSLCRPTALPIPFVAARRSAMSQTYRHCSVAFVVILAVALSSCSALNWNAQGPVKVEDVYSTENITGTFLKLLAVLHELCRFCDSSSRLSIVLSVKICVAILSFLNAGALIIGAVTNVVLNGDLAFIGTVRLFIAIIPGIR